MLLVAVMAAVLAAGFRISAIAGYARQQPRCNLPIPAYPAVPAAHVRVVAGWIFLVQLHIAQQRGPCITAFQQVVTEYPVFREASLERSLERIDVVDPFADERTLAEHVL